MLTGTPDLTVLYVMSGNQVNAKALKFIHDHRMPFIFLVDGDHHVIDEFGIYNDGVRETFEQGVPHPTTYLLDRQGIIRFKDSRKDFHVWLSAPVLRNALRAM